MPIDLGIIGDANQEVIERAYSQPQRHPTFALFVEGVGDISEDVLKLNVATVTEDSLQEPNYGRGAIEISNVDGKYTDAEVPIIEEDSLVRVFAGFEGENIPVWTGVVTNAKSTGSTETMTLSVAQMGEKFRNRSTSGDFSSYNTPKLLVEYLAELAFAPVPEIQNDTFAPTTVTFGNTDIIGNRTLWAFLHGAGLNISYVPYFDEFGRLTLVHRSTVNDSRLVLDDDLILNVQYIENATLINEKIVDYGTGVRWGDPQLGDKIHPGQTSVTKSNEYSQNRWGTHSNYETDPLIGTFDNAKKIALEIIDWFPFRRAKYKITSVGIPHLRLYDRLPVISEKFNLSGLYTIIGREHHISPGSYTTDDIVISHGERL